MRIVLLIALLQSLAAVSVEAGFAPLFAVGVKDESTNEFAAESGFSNPLPGSAVAIDDDYYLAGNFAIGTVSAPEPVGNWERSLTSWDPNNRVHFTLSAGEALSTARIRIETRFIWGGWWNVALGASGEGFGTHPVQFKLNGVVLHATSIVRDTVVIFEANVVPLVGENILEISRSGGTSDAWVGMDYLSMDLHPTATLDADGDGLPRYWEEDHGLSDANPNDDLQDGDGDGSHNEHEFARQTDPQNRDTDADGLLDGAETVTSPILRDSDGDTLSDGEEVLATPPTNPLLADTDADGAPDAWEVRTGYDATSASSFPPAFPHAIGLQFVSHLRRDSGLSPLAVTGWIPQMNWNVTRTLTHWNTNSGNTTDITSPNASALVNSAGASTPVTVSWTSAALGVTSNGGSTDQEVMSSYLNASSATPVSITMGNIPHATFDVLVYVGSAYDGVAGYVRLNDAPGSDRHFRSATARPEREWIESPVNSPSRPWRGNVIRFRNVTGTSVNVKVHVQGDSTAGVHAIQIVNASADTDNDGIPDSWELKHRLKAGSAADASLDSDSDGLTHLQEFALQTNPHLADSDGDGLSDGAETTTSPLLADSDSDGLSDKAELIRKPLPTNPNLADTDGDGRNDREEEENQTDPLIVDGTGVPVVQTSPRQFTWAPPDFQLVWDHGRGHFSDAQWGDQALFTLRVTNQAATYTEAVMMSLRFVQGRIGFVLHSSPAGAFSHPGQPSWDLWDGDWSQPPADLVHALGFSGYGRADISDRIRMRMTAQSSGSESEWTLSFELKNMDTNQVLASRVYANCTLESHVHNGSAVWLNDLGQPNRLEVWTHPGFQAFSNAPPLGDTPAFAAHKDTDNDGMPDVWETAHGFILSNPADGGTDRDLDGLSNRDEYLAGTNPDADDSDGDGVFDAIEVAEGSDPTLVQSRPLYHAGAPSGVQGEDLNGNGLSDAWEFWVGRFDLLSGADSDGDGMSNAQEAVAGLNPFDPQSRLWSNVLQTGNDIQVSWPLLSDKSHRVWTSPDLVSWSAAPLQASVMPTEMRQTFLSVVGGADQFYQVRVGDLDSDSDGVSDWAEENVLGSQVNNPSSLRAALPVDDNGDGTVDRMLSGDYVSLLSQFQGGASGGGFSTSNGIASNSIGNGVSPDSAARFLMQSSFGPTRADIEKVQQLGYETWIAQQLAVPPTLHSDYIREIHADFFGPRVKMTYSYNEADQFINGNNMMTAFARATILGQDQLRQRVAFALSQILVASRRDANLESRPLAVAHFYDIFTRHALGNYFDVLMEVTMHPVMGRYLSHIGNEKADPSINRYPDENYARELMQLFTIGLWQLNPDGSRVTDSGGHHVPTYSNQDITQMARVMTGFWFGGRDWGQGGWTNEDHTTPMSFHADRHDFGEKTLLNAQVIPSRAATEDNAFRDVRDAVRGLFEHSNTAPFVCRQLIQFLVTDNPAPAYVARVAAVFVNNGSGVRGDLTAVVRAILLDQEARGAVPAAGGHFGRLKEPVIRTMAMARAFGLTAQPDLLWWDWGDFLSAAKQEPTNSPSVFNFYRPDYRAPGLLTQSALAGPVFQITDSYSAIAFPNEIWSLIESGFSQWQSYSFPLNLSHETALAATPEKLVDHLNTLICAGGMKLGTRNLILAGLQQIPVDQAETRARLAVYLTLTCPEGAIMK